MKEIVIATSGVFALITLTTLLFMKNKKKLHKVATIERLTIHPVKSVGGVNVPYLEYDEYSALFGVFRDRMWIVKNNESGRFISHRDQPSLVLIKPSFKNNQLCLDAPNMETLTIDILKKSSEDHSVFEITIFDSKTEAVDVGEEAASWFKKYLNLPDVRLLQQLPDIEKRKQNDPFKLSKSNKIIFQDGSAINILSQPSIDDLNNRLDKKVSYKNFRPNIVTTGNVAYHEDKWFNIKIGTGELRRLKPCDRCVGTTIDNEVGVKDPKLEPLKTLRKYRICQNMELRKHIKDIPMLGIDCAVIKAGIIKVGDEIFAELDDIIY